MSEEMSREERARRLAYRRKRKIIFPISRISFLVSLLLSVIFMIILINFGFIPKVIIIGVAVVLLLLNAFLGIIALMRKASNSRKTMQIGISAVLSVLLLLGCIVLPKYSGKIKKVLVPIPKEGEMNISVYTLKEKNLAEVSSLSGRRVGIQDKLDTEYQEFAIKVVNNEVSGHVTEVKCEGIYDAVDKLYAGTVDAIMLNETYTELIEDNDDYKNFSNDTNKVYTVSQKKKLDYTLSDVDNILGETFVVGVIGNDSFKTETLTKETGFRSDVNMAVVVDPVNYKVLIVTLPRDSYVPIDGVASQLDKLTHAPYFKGINGWVKTLESYLNFKMNYFVKVNFVSMVSIVDALGGVEINNPAEFSTQYVYDMTNKKYYPHTFEKGVLHLNGEEALAFCRERKTLKNGDMGRNEHQIMMLKALVKKISSNAILEHIDDLLDSLSGMIMTNLSLGKLETIAQFEFTERPKWEIYSYAITGTPKSEHSWGTDRMLSMVILDDVKVSEARSLIQNAIAGNWDTVIAKTGN